MKEKKLPDLFVQFKDGVAWGTYYKREHGKDYGDKFTVARYTPAKPAKVCRWTKRRDGYWEWCDPNFPTIHRPLTYCGRCGGKIKVTR